MSQAPDERFHVSRELYSPAPEGIAVYAQNTSYVSTRGQGLVESFKHEALHFDAWGNKVYYHPLIQRRLSPDGGRTWHPSAIQSTENGDGLAGRRRHVSIHTLDETRNVLLSLHCTYDVDPSQEMFAKGILRDSVRVIQDRPPGLPEQVRYTNWGIYQERGTGDLILTLPEQPKLMDFTAMTRPEHYTADCCRYRVVLAE